MMTWGLINGEIVCLSISGVAQLISKLNNKPFDESDETLFEV